MCCNSLESAEVNLNTIVECIWVYFCIEMAEQPGDKSGDASIEKMYEIFSKLLEQQQMKAVPETVKYALEPNPVRLSGPGTYVSWARHAQLILSSHGYENLLVDDEDKENCDTRTKQTNDKVLVWLLGSMDTRETHALSCMAIHLGGRKGDLSQGELRGQIGVKLITLQLQGSYHW